jgi:hypothetical protein
LLGRKTRRPQSIAGPRLGALFGVAHRRLDPSSGSANPLSNFRSLALPKHTECSRQPWFDENGGIYPVYHAIKGLSQLRGQPTLDLEISTPDELQAIAVRRDGSLELWVANLTDQTKSVELTQKLTGKVSILSATEFERATKDLSLMDSLEQPFAEGELSLPPYAVARLRLAIA